MNLASYIDHTLLKPTASLAEIEQLCSEAALYGFAAVCVPPPFVKGAKAMLSPVETKIATVIGFPFGYSATEAKLAETMLAMIDGADELDMVINLIALRMHDWDYLVKEVKLIADVIHKKGGLLKLIVETGLLADDEIIACCSNFGELGIDFMKTSTGYAEKGASVGAVQLMRKHLPAHIKIKASGGIKTFTFARALIDAGADRLGCSASLQIMNEVRE